MNFKKILGVTAVGLVSVSMLAGCRANAGKTSAKTDIKVGMVTDTGGVHDKSFNQGAWEGMQEFGKAFGLSKGNGISYVESKSEADYANNYRTLVDQKTDLIYGIGFALQNATIDAAKANPKTHFVIIDSVIEGQKNVVSTTFADNEAAYLAGVAAAETTKTDKVGFIGGVDSDVITGFRVGFEAGVKSVNPNIKIQSELADSFTDAGKGQTIANQMYSSGVDVIYQAAGGTGTGVFTEARNRNKEKNEADKVWVIGVDRDQDAEGEYTSKDGKKSNFVPCSTLKGVSTVVKDLSSKSAEGEFPGGKHLTYDLKNKGVDLTTTHLNSDAKEAVAEAKKEIVSGEVTVPSK